MNISAQLMSLDQQIEQKIAEQVRRIEYIAERNQWKVIEAFQEHHVWL